MTTSDTPTLTEEKSTSQILQYKINMRTEIPSNDGIGARQFKLSTVRYMSRKKRQLCLLSQCQIFCELRVTVHSQHTLHYHYSFLPTVKVISSNYILCNTVS